MVIILPGSLAPSGESGDAKALQKVCSVSCIVLLGVLGDPSRSVVSSPFLVSYRVPGRSNSREACNYFGSCF